jgi:uncharacterized protein with HEPN domain
MPRRSVRLYLADIIDACDAIALHTAGMTVEQFVDSRTARSATEREFTVIGEALSQAIRQDPAIEVQVTRAQSITHFRNMLVHAYDLIEPQTMWGIVQNNVPTLHAEVQAILSSLNP